MSHLGKAVIRHAIQAAEIAAVRDGYAQVVEAPVMFIDQAW